MRFVTRSAPTSSTTLSMGSVEWAMLILLSVLWGGSFFFVGVAVRDLPTLTIVVLRVGLAALVLWGVVAVLRRGVPNDPRVWIAFLGMGVLNNVIPFGLIVWSQQTIASGLASILNATTPLFTIAVAGVLLSDERINGRKIAGIAAGFTGVVVMLGPGALSGLGTDLLAQMACLGGALSYAFAGVFGRRFKRFGVDPIVVAAGQVTGSTLVLAPLALVIERPWSLPMPAPSTWAAIVGLAVLSTALAYILYFQILQRAGATNLLLVTFLIPVSAIALGVLVLGEHLNGLEIAGMVLIGAGLLAIDGRVLNIGRTRPADPRATVRR
ncbi:DMT family transporter [Roseicyclus sp. F158]|uniref:DMT family transporter n=1 Tax=Tropicimonas omnivorans TaxID=3075590 RepID=A0ABU3DIA9_9RHOB|nr:DMT family transporter [Roseicyclus sp. F158]MDT0683455.1 DMT family transporter [Roseicyclus sp. F158]